MAKRKYVKENNLVKAINTDSLELQKPLVNEYYDINVHNSNMDKIDLAIKQNKNNISENKTSIQLALEKSEQAFQRGDEVKTQLVDKLISEGLEVSTDNTFEELIGNISIGLKWALVDAYQKYYSEVGLWSTKIPLSTLGFKPQHALCFQNGYSQAFGIYSPVLTGSETTTYLGYANTSTQGGYGGAKFYNDAFYVQFINGSGYKILLIGE